MAEEGLQTNVNTVEILMDIKSDVSSIKTEMTYLKDDFKEYKAEQQENVVALNARISKLEEKVEELSDRDDKEKAKKYKTIIAFFATAVGGIVIANLSDIIKLLLKIGGTE